MKAEDAKALWPKCGDPLWFERNKSIMLVFARACEQQGIERAKAGARPHVFMARCPTAFVDFPELDAEIAKENEDER